MSKIGRKPILLKDAKVQVEGNKIIYQGKNAKGEYILPPELRVELDDKFLKLVPVKKTPSINRIWGMHRALLANILKGAEEFFEKKLRIVGLGYKAVLNGNKLKFSLGFSHKIDFEIPEGVKVEVDKSGQNLAFKSIDPMILGSVCSSIRGLRPPEPYKGTGIMYTDEVIRRKAGKAKSI